MGTVNESQQKWDTAKDEFETSRKKLIVEMRDYLFKLCNTLPQIDLEKQMQEINSQAEEILQSIRKAN